LLACLALYFLGDEALNGIAFALLAGIVVGTYALIVVEVRSWFCGRDNWRNPSVHL